MMKFFGYGICPGSRHAWFRLHFLIRHEGPAAGSSPSAGVTAQQATQGGLFGLGGSALGGVGYNASGIFGGLSKLFGPAAAAGSGTIF
jgi:hypothetical protein